MGRAVRGVVLIWLAALVLASCSRTEVDETGAGLLTDFEIEVGGEPRVYDVYLPASGVVSAPRALIVLLHGNRSSKEDLTGESRTTSPYELWQPLADSENVGLLIPQGVDGPDGQSGWNDCRADAVGNPTSDDVAFLSAAIERVTQEWGIDDGNVFAVGTSNGGHMAQRLADETPELLRGIGVIAAGVSANSTCAPSSEPLAALFMWGTSDPLAPFAGGQMASERGEILSADQSISRWVERNGLTAPAELTEIPDLDEGDESTVTRHSYRSEGRPPVDFFEVVGGGHAEPSISAQYGRLFERIVGRQNHDVESAEVIWAFFDEAMQ